MIKRLIQSMLYFALCAIVATVTSGIAAADVSGAGILEATGSGTVDMTTAKSKVQARMLAKRAAKVDAQRNLLEVVEGVRVTAGTTVKDAQLESDLIANRVKGMLRGAFVISESVEEMEGSYYAEVKLGVCLDGGDPQCGRQPTLSQIVYAGLAKSSDVERYSTPTSAEQPSERVTGLVVDLGGMGFSRYLDVRLKNEAGKELYGPGHFDAGSGPDWLHWADTVDAARTMADVVGEQPLVVSAKEIRNASEVIVSEETAAAVYRANAQNGDFLRQGGVILVVN